MKKIAIFIFILSIPAIAQKTLSGKSEPVTAKIKPLAVTVSASPAGNLDTLDLEKLAYSGKNYALLIGVSTYADRRLNLKKSAEEVRKLFGTLTKNYNFDAQNVTMLNNPRRFDMMEAFAGLHNRLQANDNLIVFFAGQTAYDTLTHEGFWLPIDANRGNRGNYVASGEVRNLLKSMNCRRTLLLTQACFSGEAFKVDSTNTVNLSASNAEDLKKYGNEGKRFYLNRSRQALVSGNFSENMESDAFVKLLTEKLNENPKQFLSVTELFTSMKTKATESGQNPELGVIQDTGSEGGEFIFIKKKSAVIVPTPTKPVPKSTKKIK